MHPPPAILALAGSTPPGGLAMEHLTPGTGTRFLVGHPPAEPSALLAQARAALSALPFARQASRAWLSVSGQGEGLVVSVLLEDPASEPARAAATDAIEHAAAAVALRVPFPVDVIFPGEPRTGFPDDTGTIAPADAIDAWIAENTRPSTTATTATSATAALRNPRASCRGDLYRFRVEQTG